MRKALLAVVFVGMVGLIVAGCESKKSPKPVTKSFPPAYSLSTEVKALFPNQIKDPVNDEPINAQFYVDVDGMRVYFSCQESVEEFKKNQDKYLQKLEKVAGPRWGETPERPARAE